METRDIKRIIEILAYSGRPLNVAANVKHEGELFDSIEILEDDTVLTEIFDTKGNDVVALANWTGYIWKAGTVLTWDDQMASINPSKIVKINRTKKG